MYFIRMSGKINPRKNVNLMRQERNENNHFRYHDCSWGYRIANITIRYLLRRRNAYGKLISHRHTCSYLRVETEYKGRIKLSTTRMTDITKCLSIDCVISIKRENFRIMQLSILNVYNGRVLEGILQSQWYFQMY